jgi:TM2 domain-containing membrane protein YozV
MTSSLTPTQAPSEKSRGVATVLAAVLGPFGAHRFYLGKARSGVLMLATLGGLGIWWLYDLILIVSGSFRDSENRLVTRWDPEVGPPAAALPQEVYDELDALRSELAELSERLDFTERLLAQPGHDEALRRPIHPS